MKPKKQNSPVSLVGQREVTVLDDGRLKPPADVLSMLESLKLSGKSLCPERIPLAKALTDSPSKRSVPYILKSLPRGVKHLILFRAGAGD